MNARFPLNLVSEEHRAALTSRELTALDRALDMAARDPKFGYVLCVALESMTAQRIAKRNFTKELT